MSLPKTDSIRELSEFWDTHEVTEFEEQLEEVPGRVFARDMGSGIRVPLTPEERAAIRRIAVSRGVAEASLIREWVKEKLHP